MAAKKYLSLLLGKIKSVAGTVVSAGVANEGDIVALDATGKLDPSLFPANLQENFSYTLVDVGETVTIPTGQEMVVSDQIEVDGTLVIDGQVTQLVDYSLWAFGWNTIPSDVTLRVASNRDMFFYNPLTIDGTLVIDGRLIEVVS